MSATKEYMDAIATSERYAAKAEQMLESLRAEAVDILAATSLTVEQVYALHSLAEVLGHCGENASELASALRMWHEATGK